MEQQLRDTAKKLLSEKTVDVVIGYGQLETGEVDAVFITNPDDVNRLVWNASCHRNLAVYLTQKEIKKLGRPAVVVKGCDARSVVVLANESQIERSEVVLIGMVCPGVYNEKTPTQDGKQPLCGRCENCASHVPQNVDFTIGDPASVNDEGGHRDDCGNDARLQRLLQLSKEERLEYWKNEFSRCVKCYACRQNCPLCYCNQCVADKNRPVRIDTSSTLKGNFAWNILRAFHLAGRCVGCGACSSACPAGIDLDLLNLTLARTAELEFGHVSGQPGTLPLIGSFSENDKEDFIR